MKKHSFILPALAGFLILSAAFAVEFRNPRLLSNGTVELVLEGEPGAAFVVESSNDLQNWSTNQAGTLPQAGVFAFAESALLTKQFFRARTSSSTGANPLQTTASYETNVITRLIPIAGGAVRITNSNNVRFQLTIPPNSLLSEAEISLTAATNLIGAPLQTTLFAAVKAAPEDLFLFKPAELLVTFPTSQALEQAIGFGFHENGAEFHWYPTTIASNTVRFRIDQLHGYGIGRSTLQQVDQQLIRLPTDPIDQLMQELAVLQWKGRQPAAAASVSSSASLSRSAAPADWLDTSRTRLKREWDNRLKPQLTHAKTDCTTARRSIPETLRWAHAVSVIGLDGLFESEFGEMYVSICDGIENCIRQLEVICQTKSDPETVREMLRLARQSELLGCDHAELVQRALNCARLKVTFESKIDLSLFDDFYETHVRAPYVPLLLGDPDFTGQGPLNYIRFFSAYPGCVYSDFRGTDATFKVISLTFDLNLQKAQGGFLKMIIDPGEPTEKMHFQCQNGEPGDTDDMRVWRDGWDFFHADEEGPRGFIIENWVFDAQTRTAIKQYDQTFSSGGFLYEEYTTIEVSHDPLR